VAAIKLLTNAFPWQELLPELVDQTNLE